MIKQLEFLAGMAGKYDYARNFLVEYCRQGYVSAGMNINNAFYSAVQHIRRISDTQAMDNAAKLLNNGHPFIAAFYLAAAGAGRKMKNKNRENNSEN